MRTIYIYSLKDPETNEIRYVGKTTNINTRLKAHITRSIHNKYHSARWVQSVIKRGLRPIIELVEECTEENWVEREKYWIGYYRERFDLTNILEGGEGGSTFGRLGKPWSDEQRKNNAIARTGLSVSRTKEGNANRKKGVRGYYDKNKKPVLQYDLEGKFIREWESAVDAGKDLKISYSDINRSCKKEGYTSAGFQWRYKVGEVKNEINKYVKPENGSNVEVIQMTKEGERIKEFKSIMDASRQTAILNSSINNCLSGRSQSAGGYKWKYKQ
jgi:hypothetical protein